MLMTSCPNLPSSFLKNLYTNFPEHADVLLGEITSNRIWCSPSRLTIFEIVVSWGWLFWTTLDMNRAESNEDRILYDSFSWSSRKVAISPATSRTYAAACSIPRSKYPNCLIVQAACTHFRVVDESDIGDWISGGEMVLPIPRFGIPVDEFIPRCDNIVDVSLSSQVDMIRSCSWGCFRIQCQHHCSNACFLPCFVRRHIHNWVRIYDRTIPYQWNEKNCARIQWIRTEDMHDILVLVALEAQSLPILSASAKLECTDSNWWPISRRRSYGKIIVTKLQ